MCREYKCFTFARYSPQCESSIIFATPNERPRMLTNTYEYLAITLRSLRLVANCIRKPILHIFATIWRICREYIFYIRKDIRHSVRLALECHIRCMLRSLAEESIEMVLRTIRSVICIFHETPFYSRLAADLE